MKYSNRTTKNSFYLITIVFINIIFISNLWADYVNITKSGNQVMEFYDAVRDIIADYHKATDKKQDRKKMEYNPTYNFMNIFNSKKNYVNNGIDLTKKRLKSLAHSIFIFNSHIGLIYNVFGSIEIYNPKIKSIYEIIQFFHEKNDSPEENTASTLVCSLKNILHYYKSVADEGNLSISITNDKNFSYIDNLNNIIFYIYTIHEILDCDEVKMKTFFAYIAAYVDIQALSGNNTDYVSTIAYHYLLSELHSFNFAMTLYTELQSKAPEIIVQHKIAKKTIIPICNDKDLENIFSEHSKKVLNHLGEFHQELLLLVEKLCKNAKSILF